MSIAHILLNTVGCPGLYKIYAVFFVLFFVFHALLSVNTYPVHSSTLLYVHFRFDIGLDSQYRRFFFEAVNNCRVSHIAMLVVANIRRSRRKLDLDTATKRVII